MGFYSLGLFLHFEEQWHLASGFWLQFFRMRTRSELVCIRGPSVPLRQPHRTATQTPRHRRDSWLLGAEKTPPPPRSPLVCTFIIMLCNEPFAIRRDTFFFTCSHILPIRLGEGGLACNRLLGQASKLWHPFSVPLTLFAMLQITCFIFFTMPTREGFDDGDTPIIEEVTGHGAIMSSV